MNDPKLTRAVFDAIIARAERDFPDETCGFIIGAQAGQEITQEVRPITNIQNAKHAEDPEKFARDARTAFLMDPKEHLAVLNEVDRRKLELIAVYHSHPDHEAYFSATDRAQACLFDPQEPDYPDTFHVVLSVRGGRFVRAAAFVWDLAVKDFAERELKVI
ncbi:MAG TPA: M67 family metallopeptidase [Candidatus Binataceae bacterium]|nr:M67 family metallopeptidase [Candidatus Binataceae bacterium]